MEYMHKVVQVGEFAVALRGSIKVALQGGP